MKKKFKIIDASSGDCQRQEIKLKEGENDGKAARTGV